MLGIYYTWNIMVGDPYFIEQRSMRGGHSEGKYFSFSKRKHRTEFNGENLQGKCSHCSLCCQNAALTSDKVLVLDELIMAPYFTR